MIVRALASLQQGVVCSGCRNIYLGNAEALARYDLLRNLDS